MEKNLKNHEEENETVVFKPDNSIKIIDKGDTNDDRSVSDDTDFVVSDTKFIREHEVIEAEMNTKYARARQVDTQLGLRIEETEGGFGIVEEEEEMMMMIMAWTAAWMKTRKTSNKMIGKCTYRHPRSVFMKRKNCCKIHTTSALKNRFLATSFLR